jgi:hypothetical protein
VWLRMNMVRAARQPAPDALVRGNGVFRDGASTHALDPDSQLLIGGDTTGKAVPNRQILRLIERP